MAVCLFLDLADLLAHHPFLAENVGGVCDSGLDPAYSPGMCWSLPPKYGAEKVGVVWYSVPDPVHSPRHVLARAA